MRGQYKDKEKRKKYQREWVAKRRAKYWQPCQKCGSEENVQLHHRDRKTKISHSIFSWAIPRLEAELAKCDWLCRDCHWDEHRGDPVRRPSYWRPSKAICGTNTMYRKGCRCEPCKAAKRRENRRA